MLNTDHILGIILIIIIIIITKIKATPYITKL